MLKKVLLQLPVFFFFLVVSSQANAVLMFGNNDSIRQAAPASLKGANGEELYLGYRVTTHAFLLPYNVTTNGYVLGIKGDPKKFYSLPEQSVIDTLQAQGSLPKPFPPMKLGTFDYLIGYSLWIFLFFAVGVPLIRRSARRAQ